MLSRMLFFNHAFMPSLLCCKLIEFYQGAAHVVSKDAHA